MLKAVLEKQSFGEGSPLVGLVPLGYTKDMDGDIMKEKVLEQFKRVPPLYYIPIGIFGVGFVFLVIGIVQLVHPSEKNDQLIETTISVSPKPQLLTVDIEGAVLNPGVYSLPVGSRIKDALIAAGGLSPDADRQAVAKQLNLAVKVTDGGKVYIPKVGDTVAQGSTNTQVLGTATGLLNVNTATAEELDNLPGVGQVTAQKIVAARPYSDVAELLSKKVVSNAIYQKIKDKISVY